MKNRIRVYLSAFNKKSIFSLSLAVFFVFCMLPLTMLDNNETVKSIAKIFRYLCYLSFAVLSFIQVSGCKGLKTIKLDYKEMVKNTLEFVKCNAMADILLVVAILVLVFSHNRLPIILWLICCASTEYNIKSVLKIYLYTSSAFIFVICLSQVLNIIPDYTILRSDYTLRYSMGYIYPLEFMTHYLVTIITYLYLNIKKYDYKTFFVIMFINLLIYKITDARTGFGLVVLICAFCLLIRRVNFKKFFYNHGKGISVFTTIFVMAAFIIPVAISFFEPETNSILSKINDLFSNRLHWQYLAVQNYGINLFGKAITWVGNGGVVDLQTIQNTYNFVDCSYVQNILNFGVIFYIIELIGYLKVLLKSIKKKDVLLYVCIAILLLLSFMEPRLLQIELNPFVFMVVCTFFKKGKDKGEIKI